VDEYQDTNKIQASIIRALATVHKNILVVGDDAQSIYSFRAADIKNILDFETHYPGARIFKLETNYRSTPDILDVANEVISNNTKQYQKELKSVRERFTRPEVHAFLDQIEEAEFIAERILELRDEGIGLSHVAVLFRASFHTQALELELNKRNIPYEYRGGVRFFERAHVKDVLAFVRLVHNHHDSVAWSRVLSMQIGIGPAAAEKIISAVLSISIENSEKFDDLFFDDISLQLPARARVGWNDFRQIWQRMVRDEEKNPGVLIANILDSKYNDYLETEYTDARERKEDLEQLARIAQREDDLGKFLAESVLQEQFARPDGAAHDDEKMVLSTIHQAKGLEWDAVFIVNVSAGQFPSERSLGEDGGLEEERRLFYVAVTRARKYLYLSYPLTGNLHSYLQGPSQFLSEIPSDAVVSYGGNDSSTVFSDPSDAIDDIRYVSEDEPFQSKPRPKSFLKSLDEL
jgi:DNA helicase-2/ATP-dependent DNA helicase PcrA